MALARFVAVYPDLVTRHKLPESMEEADIAMTYILKESMVDTADLLFSPEWARLTWKALFRLLICLTRACFYRLLAADITFRYMTAHAEPYKTDADKQNQEKERHLALLALYTFLTNLDVFGQDSRVV